MTLSLDASVCVWSVRQKAMITGGPLSSTMFLILTAATALAPPSAHGTSIHAHLMFPARNSRIILASNCIHVLAPVTGNVLRHAVNITLLLSEKNGRCIGVTQEGEVFVLDAPNGSSSSSSSSQINSTHRLSTTRTVSPCDDHSSIGRRCMPVTARDGQHNMIATAACLYHNTAIDATARILQPSNSNDVVVLFFASPPILPMAPIDLRVGSTSGRDGVVKGTPAPRSGCLQAHRVETGQLLHVFEGCSDDISCVAVSSGDKTTGRYLLAGSDQEGGGASLFMWQLLHPEKTTAQSELLVPLLISVQVHKVYPSCGAITSIIGRATDAVVAFMGGKVAIFSLVSRNFK